MRWWLAVTLLILVLAQWPPLSRLGSPVLPALVLGMLAGTLLRGGLLRGAFVSGGSANTAAFSTAASMQRWQHRALRLGIVLFAFTLQPAHLLQTSPSQLLQLALLVLLVLAAGWWLGCKVLKLPTDQVLLVSAGLSFCGTSAIFATQSLRQASQPALSQSLAVVLAMGLLALGGYSLMSHSGWLTAQQLAWLIGSTAPEIAQAVAASADLGTAAPQAIIAKLFRVCLLVPFLLLLSLRQPGQRRWPWFVLAFVAVLLMQTQWPLPQLWQQRMAILSQACLIFAMLLTGWQVRFSDLRQCPPRLLLFAALLMLLLVSFSYGSMVR